MTIFRIILGFVFIWICLRLCAVLLKWFVLYKINKLTSTDFSHSFSNIFTKNQNEETPPNTDNQALVPCTTCGTYIIKTQAIERANRYFCCTAHLP